MQKEEIIAQKSTIYIGREENFLQMKNKYLFNVGSDLTLATA